ncbi:MAG: cyclic nucleotide-binding domain-containing protein [Nitrolancea sp.]
MDSLVSDLANQPYLAGLAPKYVELLADCATHVIWSAGETICTEGAAANSFYLIYHGKVAIEVDVPGPGVVTIETLDAGDVLGWSWLFPPYRWHFDVRATELTRMIEINASCLRTKIEEDHEFGFEMMRRFAQTIIERLQSTRLQLLDMYGQVDG